MSLRWTVVLVVVTTIAVCLVGLLAAPALAAPAAQASADRAALQDALDRYDAAEAQSAQLDARMLEVTAELDRAVAEEQRCQERLRSRVVAMYRSDDTSLSLLLAAESLHDLEERLDLLDRMARQDAENLKALRLARFEATHAAEELMVLQAAEAKALEAVAAEVSRAREQLAASEAALREYEARMAAAAAKRAPAPTAGDPNQQLSGTGEWQTAVASHYGRNFTGRGASGESIGPYSMIVAHKTLPFGTLIEFEYQGRRAVARVADRGPYTAGREFDLGPGVVRVLEFSGVREVRYRIISQ